MSPNHVRCRIDRTPGRTVLTLSGPTSEVPQRFEGSHVIQEFKSAANDAPTVVLAVTRSRVCVPITYHATPCESWGLVAPAA
jgi:hypothetical protein